ncbi:hypothetical protein [Aliikangiella maris]|uniref:Uncharacterized protein n=2 Tax=Aliikangiella maris TaxID=3162458 RepID=A0ABV3MNM9_9GAMM
MISKIVRYMIFIIILAYLGILWQIRSQLNDVIAELPTPIILDYNWLWIDFNGLIQISNVKLLDQRHRHLISADKLDLKLPSFWSLFKIHEWKDYYYFPKTLKLTASNAQLNSAFTQKIENYLFDSSGQNSLIPQPCQNLFKQVSENISFQLNSNFQFNYSNAEMLVDLSLRSDSVFNLKLNSKLSHLNISEPKYIYIGPFTLFIDQPVWIESWLSNCANTYQISRAGLATLLSERLDQSVDLYKIKFSDQMHKLLHQFFATPNSITISYHPTILKSISQIRKIPIKHILAEPDLVITLNQTTPTQYIEQLDYYRLLSAQYDKKFSNSSLDRSFLPITVDAITSHIGANIILRLKDGRKIYGTINQFAENKIYLNQFIYQGRSILPYQIGQVESIEVYHSNLSQATDSTQQNEN